jgi:hypothetical protein
MSGLMSRLNVQWVVRSMDSWAYAAGWSGILPISADVSLCLNMIQIIYQSIYQNIPQLTGRQADRQGVRAATIREIQS